MTTPPLMPVRTAAIKAAPACLSAAEEICTATIAADMHDGPAHDAARPDTRTTPLRRFCRWAVRCGQLALGLGVLAWLLLSGLVDWRAVQRLLTVAWVPPTAVALSLVSLAFLAVRLRLLMRPHGLLLSYRSAFQLAATAAFFSWCIPGGTGGDLVKMYFLGRWNPGRVTEAVTVTLWDRAIGLATFLMLALIGAVSAPAGVRGQPAVLALLTTSAVALLLGAAILALTLYTDWTTRPPLCWLRRLGRPGQTLLRVFHVMHGYRRSLPTLAGAVLASLGVQICLLAVCMVVAAVVTETGARSGMLVVMPLGFVANALPVTPGGLGVGEAAFEELFRLIGLSGGAAVALTWRAVAILASLPGLWFYLRGRRACAAGVDQTQQPRAG